jgi:hypothetical protein
VDDERGQDHDWGCRLALLLGKTGVGLVSHIRDLLERQLPQELLGLPVRFGVTWDPAATRNTVAGGETRRWCDAPGIYPGTAVDAVP